MKRPMSGVTARIAARYTRICSQPLIVTSEPFRLQQRVREIHEQSGAHDEADDGVDRHRSPPSRAHACTYAIAIAKNVTVMRTKSASMVHRWKVPSNVRINAMANRFWVGER